MRKQKNPHLFICTKVKTSHLFNKQGITVLLHYQNNNINTVKSHKNPKKGNENPNWKGQKVAKFATENFRIFIIHTTDAPTLWNF